MPGQRLKEGIRQDKLTVDGRQRNPAAHDPHNYVRGDDKRARGE